MVESVLAKKQFNKDAFRSTMALVWGLSDFVSFHEVSNDPLFIIKFKKILDLEQIWVGRPWLFDMQLLVLQKYDGMKSPIDMMFNEEGFWVQMHNLPLGCMTRDMGKSTRASVGVVE